MPQLIDNTVQGRGRLQGWYRRFPGRLVLEAEARVVGDLLPYLFGYHLVQIGSLGEADVLSHSRILHRAVIDVDGEVLVGADSALRGVASELPVASDSVDVVVLPHVLEFEESPHAALREAGRILVPEGHLLVTGFNPWSLFGLWRLAHRRAGGAPWHGQFIGLRRLRDWLALLDLEVMDVRYCFFRPPVGREAWLRRLAGLERFGERLWPYLAGVYVVAARKRVVPLTPLRPRWKPRRRVVSVGLAEPSTRSAARG